MFSPPVGARTAPDLPMSDASLAAPDYRQAMARTWLTRRQVLEWNPRWSLRDLEIIELALDHLPAGCSFYVPESKTYVSSFVNRVSPGGESGRRIDYRGVVISPGRIEWLDHNLVPQDLTSAAIEDERYVFDSVVLVYWIPLSTYRGRSEAVNHALANPDVCTTCFIALPATGVCDDCG